MRRLPHFYRNDKRGGYGAQGRQGASYKGGVKNILFPYMCANVFSRLITEQT